VGTLRLATLRISEAPASPLKPRPGNPARRPARRAPRGQEPQRLGALFHELFVATIPSLATRPGAARWPDHRHLLVARPAVRAGCAPRAGRPASLRRLRELVLSVGRSGSASPFHAPCRRSRCRWSPPPAPGRRRPGCPRACSGFTVCSWIGMVDDNITSSTSITSISGVVLIHHHLRVAASGTQVHCMSVSFH